MIVRLYLVRHFNNRQILAMDIKAIFGTDFQFITYFFTIKFTVIFLTKNHAILPLKHLLNI
jgi:hypothetical protein